MAEDDTDLDRDEGEGLDDAGVQEAFESDESALLAGAGATRGTRPERASEELTAAIDRLIGDHGGEPGSVRANTARDVVVTGLKLAADDTTTGEVLLIDRALRELRYALNVFRPYSATPKISVFGSARTPEDHPDYIAAVGFSKTMAEADWMVITGAGDGIMRAGHGGAGREASFGVAIRLPFETNANDVIVGDPKLITFRYFFTRKLVFMWMSHAIAVYPGGFGTQDEAFEALTLIQTGKAPMVPIVLCDAPGGTYWTHWDNYVRKSLLANGWISPPDTSLYFVTDDADAAAQHVLHFYRNYHSQRFVRDHFVLRMKRPLTTMQVEALNREYTDLIKDGSIEQGGPLKAEREHLDLPRLKWHSTKRAYGRLRQLIDRVNDFDAENA